MMQVQIPQGVAPGQTFTAAQPDGQQIQVMVPPDGKAGAIMEVPLQGAPQAAPQAVSAVAVPAAVNIQIQNQGPELRPPFGGSTMIEKWGSSCGACCSDCNTCCCAYCCPCILFGQNQAAVGGDCFLMGLLYFLAEAVGCCCIVGTIGRGEIETKLGGEPNTFCDCICYTFCSCCMIAQEARAVNNWKGQGGR